ncbi:MAG: efflux RND transporter permease subunit [Christensenellales bacterium]|nr:MMPL family transporter [Clostridiales bacterium]
MKGLAGMSGKKTSFFNLIVNNKWVFVIVFIVMSVISAIMFFHTEVIYDLSEYAPKNSNTQKAVSVLKKEFDDKGSAYIMVKNITLEEALNIQEQLSQTEGVAVVSFNADTDYKNSSALFTVSLSHYDSTPEANAAIKSIINNLSSKEIYLSGQTAMSYYTRLETVESIIKVGVIIVVAILIMLVFTSNTYFEVVILIMVFGVSVILNMGTNFLFDGISYISNLVALVLQLALSLDYSIILLHRFMEERKLSDAKTSAVLALTKGASEIFSSSLTTIAGLCSLIVMTLPIGVEMGLALAKSILFSLLTVIFFMPAVLILFDKQLQKTKHRSFVPNVSKPAKAKLKFRIPIAIVFIIAVALAGTGQFFNEYSFNINGAKRIVDSQESIAKEFGYKNDLAVIVPKGDYEKEEQLINYIKSKDLINNAMGLTTIEAVEGLKLTDCVTQQQLAQMADSLGFNPTLIELLFTMYKNENDPNNQLPETEYSVMFIDLMEFASKKINEMGMQRSEYAKQLQQLSMARANFESQNYSRIMFNINSPTESAESIALIEDLSKELGQFYDEYYLAGESVACYDMAKVFPRDNFLVSFLTAMFVLLILYFTFKNLILPLILIIAIQGSIWINFVIPFLSSSPISFIGYLLVCAIQMGATIDYGIILTNRYLQIKHLYPDKLEAMSQAENAVFPTIITSGIILTVSGLAMGLAAAGVVAKMGMLLGIGAATSMLVVLFILPSLLLIFDNIIEKTYFNKIFPKRKTKPN